MHSAFLDKGLKWVYIISMWFLLLVGLAGFNQERVDPALGDLRAGGEVPVVSTGTHQIGFSPCGLSQALREQTFHLYPDDLVIGDVPGETLLVTGRYDRVGNIVIINDGVLKLVNADFNLDGNVGIYQGGRMEVDSSNLRFVQHYIYHHIIAMGDSAHLEIRDSHTEFEGYPFNISAIGRTEVNMQRVVHQDFITAVVMEDARVEMDHVRLTGEWLFGHQAQGKFSHVDTLLTWYFFPESSEVEFRFPDGDSVEGFVLDSTISGVNGVGFHVEIDSSTNVMWAAIPLAGSDVTIDSSELRATGIIFEGSDSFDLSGLVNEMFYPDYTLPLEDRRYRLVNTTLHTWNLYAQDSSTVQLSGSIFGEFCAFGRNDVEIRGSFCDGTGGHIESAGESFMLVVFSSVMADVITKDRGVCIMAYCAMPWGNLWATGASMLMLVNCQFPEDPIPSDTAIVFVVAITGPSNAGIEDSVSIVGSAWMGTGPHNPAEFDYYRLSYRPRGDSAWVPIGGQVHEQVKRDTLGYWDTRGLDPGEYQVRVVLMPACSEDDDIEAVKDVRLVPLGVAHESVTRVPGFEVRRLGPREFRFSGQSEVEVLDITGRSIARVRKLQAVWQAPSSGVFFVRGKGSATTRRILAY